MTYRKRSLYIVELWLALNASQVMKTQPHAKVFLSVTTFWYGIIGGIFI